MKRRQFLLSFAASSICPRLLHAQQQKQFTVGYLGSTSPDGSPFMSGFHAGLKELDLVEGANVSIEYRWALGQYENIAGMAAELVQRNVPVVFASGEPAALAAKSHTSTIPIVFVSGGDPITSKLVLSYNKPGGN